MSAAFDLLRAPLLVQKMSMVGGEIQRFISNFLWMKVGDETSCWYVVPIGVPQGSVLGPKLFSIYTRGLENFIVSDRVKAISYAHDVFVACAADSTSELITFTTNTNTINKHIMGRLDRRTGNGSESLKDRAYVHAGCKD